jgi:hypothetical protein
VTSALPSPLSFERIPLKIVISLPFILGFELPQLPQLPHPHMIGLLYLLFGKISDTPTPIAAPTRSILYGV